MLRTSRVRLTSPSVVGVYSGQASRSAPQEVDSLSTMMRTDTEPRSCTTGKPLALKLLVESNFLACTRLQSRCQSHSVGLRHIAGTRHDIAAGSLSTRNFVVSSPMTQGTRASASGLQVMTSTLRPASGRESLQAWQ